MKIQITLNGTDMIVSKEDYIKLKALDLQESFSSVDERDIIAQLNKILNGDEDLTVIGMFIKGDNPRRL